MLYIYIIIYINNILCIYIYIWWYKDLIGFKIWHHVDNSGFFWYLSMSHQIHTMYVHLQTYIRQMYIPHSASSYCIILITVQLTVTKFWDTNDTWPHHCLVYQWYFLRYDFTIGLWPTHSSSSNHVIT